MDVLVGNEEDLQKGLGIPGPEVAAKSKLDPSAFFGMIDRVVQQHPAHQDRGHHAARGALDQPPHWGAVAWIDGKTFVSPTCELDVLDRVGGGDGFASGFFYGLLTGESPEEAIKLGWAHGALLDHLPRRHHHGDRWSRCGPSPRAARHASSARPRRFREKLGPGLALDNHFSILLR